MGKYEYEPVPTKPKEKKVRFVYLGPTMSGSSPLLQYPQVPIQKKDSTMNQSATTAMAPAPIIRPGMAPLLGPGNSTCECPFCNASIKTAVQYTSTSRTLIASALWSLCCCLCCLPYCTDSAKNSDHYCPSCHRYLGTYVK